MQLPKKALVPTMYFIGVTTDKSSIMTVFPKWAKALGINAEIKGINIPLNADRETYRQVVSFIKNDPFSMGALVTTHKMNIYTSAFDLFDYLDDYSRIFGEMSSISKKDGKLEGHAKDPITSGLAMENFLPENYFEEFGGEAFIMGSGGSSIAISAYLLDKKRKSVPKRLTITARRQVKLDEAKDLIEKIAPSANVCYELVESSKGHDAIMKTLPPNSLVVNATGMGKDLPGSPITDEAIFPINSIVWEINYRGQLDFLRQARAAEKDRNLTVEDGWIYFIHGWTQVIAEVFHLDLTDTDIKKCMEIAEMTR